VNTPAAARNGGRPACHGREDVFDRSGRPDLAPQALAVCRGCPVLDACRAWALSADLGPTVAGGMTAAQRRAARRRAGAAEPAPHDADHAFTWRQRIADTADPRLRRRLISDAWSSLLAAGLTREQAAHRLGVGVDECRRARETVRRASIRAARPRRDRTKNADGATGPAGSATRTGAAVRRSPDPTGSGERRTP
jgi:hypothetical protein